MANRAEQAKEAIAALGDSPDAATVRRTLNEFDARDIAAAIVSGGTGGNGGSEPLTVAPEPSRELGTDPDHPNEQPPPIRVDAPATYAFSYAPSLSGTTRAFASTAGDIGNGITIVLQEGGGSLTVDVVGATITFTGPNTTNYGQVVALGNSDPEASALAVFSTEAADDTLDFSGGQFVAPFAGGYDVGAYVLLRLAGNGPAWYVHADGGVDIESSTGDFIAQIDNQQGAYIRQPAGSTAGLTVTDSDFNEKIVVNADGAGFNGATPTTPEIPAIPLAQDVVDALLALGLVTQA